MWGWSVRRCLGTLAGLFALWAVLRFAVPVDAVRFLNVPVSLLTAVMLAVRVNDIWHQLSLGRRFTFGGSAGAFLLYAYGSAESYAQDAPAGERVPLITVVCLLVLVGLWLSRHERTVPGPHSS